MRYSVALVWLVGAMLAQVARANEGNDTAAAQHATGLGQPAALPNGNEPLEHNISLQGTASLGGNLPLGGNLSLDGRVPTMVAVPVLRNMSLRGAAAKPSDKAPDEPAMLGGFARFYEHCNWEGVYFDVFAGSGCVAVNWVGNVWNDQISSVWLAGVRSVTLHEDVNRGGAQVTLFADSSCLGSWNDQASSLTVCG